MSEAKGEGPTEVVASTPPSGEQVAAGAPPTATTAPLHPAGSSEPGAGEDLEPAGAETSELRSLAYVLESVLFAAGEPLPLRRLVEILDGPPAAKVEAALELLRQEYRPGVRGIHLVEVAGGYQFRTARENASWVQALFAEKPARLSRATLETLAIVAYKQPVTKAEIEAIRGVDADGPLQTLLQRGLIRVAGRKETVGRPLLYATTPEFLETFGLKSLNELPPLPEGSELPAGAESLEAAQAHGEEETNEPQTPEHSEAGSGTEEYGGTALASGTTTEDPQPRGPGLPAGSGEVDS